MVRYLMLAVALLFSSTVVHAQTTTSRWHNSLAVAQERAKVSGKPVLLVFRCER